MEIIDLYKFRQNANDNGVCDEYAKLWDKALSKVQLMDLALSVAGSDYLCDAIAKGWGVSPEYICSKFTHYINGRYEYTDESGYTSMMYCMFDGDVSCTSTLLTLINCDMTIHIPQYHMCQVNVTGNCKIDFTGEGSVVLFAYGDTDNITISSEEKIKLKVKSKERD